MSGRILYVEHSIIIGGSSVSLREIVIEAGRSGYECHVICASEIVANLYRGVGAAAYVAPVFHLTHNTAYWYRFKPMDILRAGREVLRILLSFFSLMKVVRSIRPQVVHLNSSTLIAYSLLFKIIGIPAIFHVRENIVHGYFGFRRRLIRLAANWFCRYIIYISEHEFELLKTTSVKSFVIYNFVHVKEFTADQMPTQESVRVIQPVPFRVITLGGLFCLKGGKIILEALALTHAVMELHVVGSSDPRLGSDRFEEVDSPDYVEETLRLLNDPRIASRVKFFGKVSNPAPYIMAADALIFWAGAPHFPRTVFEAWMLKKPVIYHNPDFVNPFINERNVQIVTEKSPGELANSMDNLQESYLYTEDSRAACFKLALENFSEKNFQKIASLYESCIRKTA